MADILHFEIVTPTGVALASDVIELGAPTLDGEVGVLPGHVPLLAAVRTGLVSVRPVGSSANDPPLQYAVAHGVLEVANQKALLLTEKFIKKESVDTLAVRSKLRDVGEELAAFSGEIQDEHRIELIEEEQWLAAQLELIGDPPQPTIRELTRFKSVEVESVVETDGANAGAEEHDKH